MRAEDHGHAAGAYLFLEAVASNNGTRVKTRAESARRFRKMVAHKVLRRMTGPHGTGRKDRSGGTVTGPVLPGYTPSTALSAG